MQISATSRRKNVSLIKLDKHTWHAEPVKGPLTLVYQVYAWDMSVRGAHLDQSHGFFNGTSVFLAVRGQESQRCTVKLSPPAGSEYKSWRVATTLPAAGAKVWQFGMYQAGDYDELIDHPVELGTFDTRGFMAGGARHEVVITGHHDADFDRLVADLKPICEAQIRMFEPRSKKAPVKRYLFLTTAVGDGYGGLEHRASTALICSRNDLPYKGMEKISDGYKTFLGLASHEYFHTWNVKRIKPAAFAPYPLQEETYSELLWVFEGFTSYYDDLFLLRSGVIELDAYLKLLSRTISNVQRGPGREKQSVAESSFDAWTRFYKQDENAVNAIVSYYTKGSLVALAIDLAIRDATRSKKSLDDVMRLMWTRYGRDFQTAQRGIEETDMPALIEEATGVDLTRQLRQWVFGTKDIPLARLLKPFGVEAKKVGADKAPVSLEVRLASRNNACAAAVVFNGGPAHQAGISAGDTIIAVDSMRITSPDALNKLLARYQPGQTVTVSVFRQDILQHYDVKLKSPPKTGIELTSTKAAKRLYG